MRESLAVMTTRCTISHGSSSLAGRLDLPNAETFPLVILLHGFTGWKEEEHLDSLAKALCARGIGALRYDAPGSGESDGTFADDYRMTNYLASVENVVAFVRGEFGIDMRTTGIWGHSMGGFVAIASACRLGGFAAVCGSQSPAGRHMVSAEYAEAWRSTGWASFPNSHFTTLDLPFHFYLDRSQYDLLEIVPKLDAPLLLISGEFDVLVPASQVKAIHQAAPEPKTYREFPAGHDYKNDPEQLATINEPPSTSSNATFWSTTSWVPDPTSLHMPRGPAPLRRQSGCVVDARVEVASGIGQGWWPFSADDVIDASTDDVVDEARDHGQWLEIRGGHEPFDVFSKCRGMVVDGEKTQVGASQPSEFLVGHASKSAFRVLHHNDGVDAQNVTRKSEAAKDVVGDPPARITYDMGFAKMKAERGEHVDPRIHACDDREPTGWVSVGHVDMRRRVFLVGGEELSDLSHAASIVVTAR